MGWISVALFVTFLTGLSVAQKSLPSNISAKSIGARFLIHDKVVLENKEFKDIDLKNGSHIKQKITRLEVIDTEQEIPDDENFVISKIVSHLFRFEQQIKGKQTTRMKYKDMINALQGLLTKNQNNKNLAVNLRHVIKHILLQIGEMDAERIQKAALERFFEAIKRDIQRVTQSYLAKDKMLLVKDVDKIIDRFVVGKVIHEKNSYKNTVENIANILLINKQNLDKIRAKAKKAVDMYNIKNGKEIKVQIFDIVIRTLALSGYRLGFPEEYYVQPDLPKILHHSNISLAELPIAGDDLRTIIRRETRLHESIKETIFNILMKTIERGVRRQNSGYIASKEVKGENPWNNEIRKIKILRELDHLEQEKRPVMPPRESKRISHLITQKLDTKDLQTIKSISYETMKTIARELGLQVVDSYYCQRYQKCMKGTQKLQKELGSSVLLDKFARYWDGKLYDIQFSSRFLGSKLNQNVKLFKILDEEFENNGYNEKNLAKTILKKRFDLDRIINYLTFLKRNCHQSPSANLKSDPIVYNAQPLKANSILYRQNLHDMGYIISLAKPYTLIDASIKTFVEFETLNPSQLKVSANVIQPYVDHGDTMPGSVKSHQTKLRLEIATTKQNVKVLLTTKRVVEFACFSVNIQGLNLKIEGEVKGVNSKHKECKEYDWEIQNVDSVNANPSALIGVDTLAICNP